MNNNRVTVVGCVSTNFILDHNYYDEKFYQFILTIKRQSGTDDIIPVIVSEKLIDVTNNIIGQYVSIEGEFRSYNLHDNGKTRVILYIFPLKITQVDELINDNNILLQGYICKEPVYRETPYGRLITDVLLAVNRTNHKTDYIPCIVWGRNAYYVSTLPIGTQIRLAGRVQSRRYNKNDNVRTAYEVSVNIVETVS